MAQAHGPEKVKLIVGMFSGAEGLFELAEEGMANLWGLIDVRSEVMAFTQTRYYEKEMGANLLRKFVSFDALIDPGRLAEIKHQSNALEADYAACPEGRALGVERPINLDPGYIEPSKLVLATTKNFSHRVYIGQSMYAEPTLQYCRGKWRAWPFTFPDFGSGVYDEFLNRARKRFMEQSKSQS